MHLKNVRNVKVVALATALFYLSTCDLTVKAYVIPENTEDLPKSTSDTRNSVWTMQSLVGLNTEVNQAVMEIKTDDAAVFENNAAGVGNFMPALDEVVILDESTLEQEIILEEIEPKVDLRANLTEAELLLMYNIVAAEAKGESYEGKIAVAEVIFNRLDSKKFQNSITDIIYAPNQFQPVSNGSITAAYANLNSSTQEDIRNAVQEALQGSNYAQGALFFKTKNYHTGRTPIVQIGNHYFSK